MYLLFILFFHFPSQGQQGGLLDGTVLPGTTDLEQEFNQSEDLDQLEESLRGEVGSRTRSSNTQNSSDGAIGDLIPQMDEAGDLCNPEPPAPPDEINCNKLGALREATDGLSKVGEKAGLVRNRLSQNSEEGEEIGPNLAELQIILPLVDQILAEQGFRRNAEGFLVSPSGQVLPKYTANLTDKQLLAAGYTKKSIAATRANEANYEKQKRLAAAAGKTYEGPFTKRKKIAIGPFGASRRARSLSSTRRQNPRGSAYGAAQKKGARRATGQRGLASSRPVNLGPKDFRPDEFDKLTINYRGTPIGTAGSSVFRVISEAYGNASLYEPQ